MGPIHTSRKCSKETKNLLAPNTINLRNRGMWKSAMLHHAIQLQFRLFFPTKISYLGDRGGDSFRDRLDTRGVGTHSGTYHNWLRTSGFFCVLLYIIFTVFLLSNCCHNTQTLAIVGLFYLKKFACMVSKLYQKPPSLWNTKFLFLFQFCMFYFVPSFEAIIK